MAWLLDTNILSEKRKPKRNEGACVYARCPLEQLYISGYTCERAFGIEMLLREPAAAMNSTIGYRRRSGPCRSAVLPITEDILFDGGSHGAGRKAGHTYRSRISLSGNGASHGLPS